MSNSPKVGFGTFKGVFIPSILTIFGVIMYLRMGWLLGSVGIVSTVLIVTIASAITFLTALSISATATNMKIGAGGAYYMISRSFGVEAGAAIGLPLFFAQALGVSFYIAGFAEAVHSVLPQIPMLWIGVVSLVGLGILAYFSADLVLKTQLLIFVLILASIISFFLGGSPQPGEVTSVAVAKPVSFWVAFAVFFPAVTGIEAGISMSGDLKNPSRSLPLGTLAAVLIGYVVYLAIPVFLWNNVPPELLLTRPMIMSEVARFGFLIFLGIWGATLSSALGALLGAPRTLQALARDGIVPRFLGKGAGVGDEPRIATVVAFSIALAGVLLGDLDAIAPILSMFFLVSYGILNLSAGFEGLIGNPSWRPRFRTPWVLSLLGAGGCFSAMLMIDAGATYIALFLCFLVYYVMQKRQMRTRWGDIRRGIFILLARFAIHRMETHEKSARSWRPHLLVLSGSPATRWYLIQLADEISHGKSFVTVASILRTDAVTSDRLQSIIGSTREFLRKRGVRALVNVHLSDDVMPGLKALVQNHGIGPLVPNTILLGECEREENISAYVDLLRFIHSVKRNLVVVREDRLSSVDGSKNKKRKKKRIDLWWGGNRQNANLMLALAYMLQTSAEWRGSDLCVRGIVGSEEERQGELRFLTEYLTKGRLAVDIEIFVQTDEEDRISRISQYSADADLVFIGIRPFEGAAAPAEEAQYYRSLLARTETLPMTAFVMAAEGVEFDEIFD